MITIYHNPRCSKSRETLAFLQDRGADLNIIEYLKAPLDAEQLKALIAQSDLTVRESMRTNEAVYKELQLDQANDEALIAAMVEHPILLNRPFVQTAKGARLARPLEAIEAIL